MKPTSPGPLFGPYTPLWRLPCLLCSCLLALTASYPPPSVRTPPPSQYTRAQLIAAERWLEAECAQDGEEWQPDSSDVASNRFFVYFPGAERHPRPKRFGGASQLKFTVDLSVTADYTLYFRINSPEKDHNSVWVSIDDGPWAKFWKQRDQRQLSTDGFEWREVVDDGSPLDLNLSKGSHVIRVAARETGTQLDKIFLSPAGRNPSGLGAKAPDCPRRPASTLTSTPVFSSTDPAPLVFPNPAGRTVTVRLPKGQPYPTLVRILGADGRQYAKYSVATTDLTAANDLQIDVQGLRAGAYHLILSGERQQVPLRASFVKLE